MVTQSSTDLIFRALADPTRRAILALLGEEGLAVLEIAERFPVSRPAVSKHLRVLREAGLVDERRRGRRRVYAAVPAALAPAAEWLGAMGEATAASKPSRRPREAAARPRAAARRSAPRRRNDADSDWRFW